MLTARFEQALARAVHLHRDQIRKGTSIPYVAHLLNVTGLALSHGASEDVAIAAILHDAVEDTDCTVEELAAEFGPEVARIVGECSDTDEVPKPPWAERKRRYLAHLPQASTGALLVSASDKLDNARAILLDYRSLGDALWTRFQGGRDGTLWYYRALTGIYRDSGRVPAPLLEELDRVVTELEGLAAATP